MGHRVLNLDIKGRVQKIRATNPLLPLFEAIVNSIESIEERKIADGKIEIEIIRDVEQAELLQDDDRIPQVTGFKITDNGIGFNEKNFESFCLSDTTNKLNRGGRGVGRFSWLKFFRTIKIYSTFENGKNVHERFFNFDFTGVDSDEARQSEEIDIKTTVTIDDMYKKYSDKCPKDAEKIANKIIEHFLYYFTSSHCPEIWVMDNDSKLLLQQIYREEFGEKTKKHSIMVMENQFSLTGLRLYKGNQVHTMFLCGNRRVADKVTLSAYDPILGRKLEDHDGNNFAYWVFVESGYLDMIVNEDREGFRFPVETETNEDIELTIKRSEVVDNLLPTILSDLEDELSQVREINKERVSKYVHTVAPEYRAVLARYPDRIENISKTNPKDIDAELRRIQFDMETDTNKKVQEILNMDYQTIESVEDYKKKVNEIFKSINEVGKASLAKYIVKRKVILDILEKRMEIIDDKYPLEEAIHGLVFPMKTESDTVEYEDQNLWIIDERLSYHSYLASDKPINVMPIDSDSKKEPDIIIFNRPIALHDSGGLSRTYESIEIIEFKRPGRDDYTEDSNPVLQVIKYIEKLRDNKVKNYKGRPVEVTDATHYYCYIICDISPRLRTILDRRSFITTPDDQGAFFFLDKYRAYIEVISYNKMLALAKQRNRVLFNKLQINQ